MATTIDLKAEEQKSGAVNEAKALAEVASIKADMWLRVVMVIAIAAIFIGLNWSVIAFVQHAYNMDIELIKASAGFKPADRVITTNIFVSLIGATVVQVGVAIIAIVSYLFPKKPGT